MFLNNHSIMLIHFSQYIMQTFFIFIEYILSNLPSGAWSTTVVQPCIGASRLALDRENHLWHSVLKTAEFGRKFSTPVNHVTVNDATGPILTKYTCSPRA